MPKINKRKPLDQADNSKLAAHHSKSNDVEQRERLLEQILEGKLDFFSTYKNFHIDIN